MPKFHIRAATKENDLYDEVVESPDRFQVYREIRSRGDRVMKISEEGKNSLFSLAFLDSMLHGISSDDKVFLVKNLAAMLDAGLTTSRAVFSGRLRYISTGTTAFDKNAKKKNPRPPISSTPDLLSNMTARTL